LIDFSRDRPFLLDRDLFLYFSLNYDELLEFFYSLIFLFENDLLLDFFILELEFLDLDLELLIMLLLELLELDDDYFLLLSLFSPKEMEVDFFSISLDLFILISPS
jgi:hypothetical protein